MAAYGNIDGFIKEIMADSENAAFTAAGQVPLFAAPEKARILVVGQAPGRIAMESRLFWNDPSGDRLREWMGVDREFFYDSGFLAVLPMDFYFPGKGKSGDLPPRRGFAEKWHPKILKSCPDIRLTILIGQYSMKYYLGDRIKKTLTETVKSRHEYLPDFFPLVHPSPRNRLWLSRNPWFEAEAVPELREAVKKALA